MLLKVEVLLLERVRRIHIKRVEFSLLRARLLHQDDVESSAEFLRFLCYDVVNGAGQQNWSVVSVAKLINATYNL